METECLHLKGQKLVTRVDCDGDSSTNFQRCVYTITTIEKAGDKEYYTGSHVMFQSTTVTIRDQ